MLMRVMTAMAMTMTIAACAEPDECESGETRCNGDVVELCNGDIDNPSSRRLIWTELEDCTDNVDSGNTVCGSFDGTPICEAPGEA